MCESQIKGGEREEEGFRQKATERHIDKKKEYV